MSIKKKKVLVMDSGGAAVHSGIAKAVNAGELKEPVIVHRYVVLGKIPESHMTALEKMDMARRGISKKSLETMKEKTGLGYERLARTLSVTKATLINKKRAQKFGPTLSESIVGLADIYSYGYEVFGEEEQFNQWMSSPNQALGGEPRLTLQAASLAGKKLGTLLEELITEFIHRKNADF